jgi:hypothetical protein
MKNPLRQDLWRAGHAHAGVWLVLALVALRYVDEANLFRGTEAARANFNPSSRHSGPSGILPVRRLA